MNSDKFFYITSPIYYVNDIPHVGHFYTTLACDVITRYKRMCNYNVLFVTGTDEHGIKVENKAKALNIPVKELVDKLSKSFSDFFIQAELTHNKFIRTTSEEHKEVVSKVWNILDKKGYIYKGYYEGYYSVSDEAFYSKSDLISNKNGDLAAVSSGSLVEPLKEESYFFKLSEFQESLLKFYNENPNFVEPKEKYNEVKSFVSSGLKDLSISRLKVKWGIPVPNNPNHTVYVWLDALSSYLTGAGYNEVGISEKFNNYWPANVHMVGKDILKFHAIYWPAFLMALDLPMPKKVFAHGWWTNNKQKISKSLGNAINPLDLINLYGLDETKYFLLKEIPFGNDGDFNTNALLNRINTELVNEYGNLCQRSISIVYNSLSKEVTKDNSNSDLKTFTKEIQLLFLETNTLINKQQFNIYLEKTWKIIKNLNIYINDKAPWQLIKNNNMAEANNVLYTIVSCIKDISLILLPFIPNIANNMLNQIGYNSSKYNFEQIGQLENSYYIQNKPMPIIKKVQKQEAI